jgi:hypothetical protein
MDLNIREIRQRDRLRTPDGVQYVVKSASKDGRVIRCDLVEGIGAKIALVCETEYLAAHFRNRVNPRYTQVMTVEDFNSVKVYEPKLSLDAEIAEADRIHAAAEKLASKHVETVESAPTVD